MSMGKLDGMITGIGKIDCGGLLLGGATGPALPFGGGCCFGGSG